MSLGLHAFLDEVDPKILEKVTKFDPFGNLVFEKFPPFTGGAKSLFTSFPSAETIPVFRKKDDFHLQKTNPNKAFEMKEWEIEGMSLVQTKSQKQYASIYGGYLNWSLWLATAGMNFVWISGLRASSTTRQSRFSCQGLYIISTRKTLWWSLESYHP